MKMKDMLKENPRLWLLAVLAVSAGGEAEGPGPVSHVSVSLQIQRVEPDENQLLHLPEPVLRGDWVYHLHQC